MVDPNDKEDIIEIECEECKAEFEMKYNEAEHGEPVYCPFCGADLNYDWDDDEEEDNKYTSGKEKGLEDVR